MAGTSIDMAKGSWMMIHEAHGATHGRAADFRQAADRLEATNQQLVEVYSERWKGSEKELRAALSAETWLNPASAISSGLADKSGDSLAIAAYIDKTVFSYANLPEELSAERLPEIHKGLEEKLSTAFS
jgi:ATP-dependent protease ClpP protease subunit